MGGIFLLGPFSNLVLSKIGFNYTMILSTVLCITSLISSSFVNSVHLLILTYSIIWAGGSSLANQASFVIVQENYRGKLCLANGIASSGTGIGTLVVGPFLGYVLRKYNFRWAFRICAVTPLLFLLSILFLKMKKAQQIVHPVPESTVFKGDKERSCVNLPVAVNEGYEGDNNENVDTRVENKNIKTHELRNKDNNGNLVAENKNTPHLTKPIFQSVFAKELWKNKTYSFFTVGVSIFVFGYYIPFVFLVSTVFVCMCVCV